MFSIKTKYRNACSRQVEVPLHFNRQLDPGKQHMPMNRKHIPSLLAVGLCDKNKKSRVERHRIRLFATPYSQIHDVMQRKVTSCTPKAWDW